MIIQERSAGVNVARIARPPNNALDGALAAALTNALDDAVRAGASVLHLRSDERCFCGGTDPARLQAWLDEGGDAIAADAASFDALFNRLEAAPLVVIAEIGGPALGAGLGLALACDLRIASRDARFGVPEAKVGALPPGGTMARLAAVAGRQAAKRLLFTAELVNGDEAFRLGFVDRVTGPAELPEVARALAARIATLSPTALSGAKAALVEDHGRAVAHETDLLRSLASSAPDRERLSAFLTKLSGSGTSNGKFPARPAA